MGTRADFYVGKGKDAEWLGSIAWDGYRDGIAGYILKAKTEANFRKAVEVFLKSRDDSTFPDHGWPWPWDNSSTTDCSYWFYDGQCWEAIGYPKEHFVTCRNPLPHDGDGPDFEAWLERQPLVEFPDMSARKNMTLGPRSGLIVLRA